MMDRLREGANSIVIKIILSLIMLSFVFAGVSSYLVGGSNNSAAKVDGVKISLASFEQAYQNERNRMQSQLGEYFSNLLADPSYVASFRRSVLDRMVNDVLLEEHAKSLGMRISDEQIREQIFAMPQFQSDGKFDQEIYQSALRRAGYSADSFAAYMRSDLLRQQLVNAVQESEFSLNGEVNAQGLLLGQTRTVKTIELNPNDFSASVEVTDPEIEQYYQAHQDQFTRPEQFQLAYLQLSADGLKNGLEIDDATVEQYYQEHLDQYSTKAQRRLSHILLPVADRAAAEDILTRVNNGEDFAELAKSVSKDPGSAEQGGDLGWVEKGVMVPEFEEAAFALENVGDVSAIVETSFGLHIIKLTDEKPAQAKPFDSVKEQVIAELRDQKAAERFYELQTELERVAFEYPDSLNESAKVTGQPIETTDFVSVDQLPAVLQSANVIDAINHPEVKEDGLNSSVIQLAAENVVVVRVNKARAETVLPLAEVTAAVREQLVAEKAQQAASELAQQVLAKLNQGDESFLQEKGLSFSEEQIIDRNSPLADAIFSMKKPAEGEVVYSQTQDLNGNVIVAALSKISAESNEQLNQQLDAQLERLNRQHDISGLISVLRDNADIEYYLATQ